MMRKKKILSTTKLEWKFTVPVILKIHWVVHGTQDNFALTLEK